MQGFVRWLVLLTVLASYLITPAAQAQSAPPAAGTCREGVLPHGALWLICVPASDWNGSLVVWAHGYTAFNKPLGFQNLTLPDGTYLPDLIQGLGYAFATTSYRQNGLAILEGVEDVAELVQVFPSVAGRTPRYTYLTGASEGGIITTLSIERHPQLYSGGLALCGPVGDFQRQIDYWGDFHVLFDYFFPGVIPGDPTAIPAEVIANWETIYVSRIRQALAANPSALDQLLKVSKAPFDSKKPATKVDTVLQLMWYNVFATNDGIAKLGGIPYSNIGRRYSGSSNDTQLNARVRRISATPAAIEAVKAYQTSGLISRPLVLSHTTGDEVIPFWHQTLYENKVRTVGDGEFDSWRVSRYGHCKFNEIDLLLTFGRLIVMVEGGE